MTTYQTLVDARHPIDVSVSIVSYNTRDLLRVCLQSLRARGEEGEACLEIIVVDNGSQDDSVEMVREEFPEVRVIHGQGNIGYGRANNLAFERARGRYFWILNSDTDIWPGAVRAMLSWMDQTPRAGACAVQLMLPDGSIQDSCATSPSLLDVFYEQTKLHMLFGGRKPGLRSMTREDYKVRQPVEQAVGACLWVRSEAFAQAGGFDPAYFMYFEDTDLCVRLRRAGWEIWFLPEARIGHFMGASSAGDWRTRARMVSSYNASRFAFYSRYQGRRGGAILKLLTMLGALGRALGWNLLALRHASMPQKRRVAREKVRLFRQVWHATHQLSAPRHHLSQGHPPGPKVR